MANMQETQMSHNEPREAVFYLGFLRIVQNNINEMSCYKCFVFAYLILG